MENKANTKPFLNSTIPGDWDVKKLREILIEGKLGGNYENSEANNGIPVIKMGNLDRGAIKIDRVQYLPENEDYNKEDVLEEGDLLFNTRNTLELVGKVAIWKNELPFAVYNSNLMRMNFDKKFVASNWFMNYVFNSHSSLGQLRGIATGTTSVAAIYGRDLETIKFALPPLPEQKAIAHILNLMDTAINQNNQIIAQKELRKKWLMQNLLTGKKRLKGFEKEKWEIIKLVNICEFIKTYSISRDGLTKEEDGSSVYCIHYGDIHAFYENAFLDFAIQKNIPQIIDEKHVVNEKDYLQEGDIIMADASEDYEGVGEIVEVVNLNNKIAVGGLHTIVLRGNSEIIGNKFRGYLFSSETVRNILRKMATGSSVYSVTKTTLQNLSVIIPNSLKEQTAIAQLLQAADKEIQLLKTKTEKLRQQKKGMMQVLLTGKKRLKI
jgi:type I restriction enzyme, S subunit